VQLTRDFQEFLQLLETHGVRYLIVGGYAVAAHTVPRYTKDLDIWIDASPANAARVMAALEAFGFGSLGLTANDFEEPDQVIQLGYDPNCIDILTGISGVAFEDAYPKRMSVKFGTIEVAMIDRKSLAANKRATGRARDLADAEELEK
jgi:hypothetical protein